MDPLKTQLENKTSWRTLAFLANVLVFSMSTWFSVNTDQSYVETALTIQLAAGFAVTVVTIWLLPYLQEWFSWRWAFTLLVPGPIMGILAMLWLKSLPVAAKIGGGKG